MSQVRVRLYSVFGTALLLAVLGCVLSPPAGAQVQYQFNILHAFGGPGDGQGPRGPVVFDRKGNLYGVSGGGGAYGYGTVFELTPGADGQWTETILHNFSDGPTDGYYPVGVVIDEAGNLYGATTNGGTGNQCPSYGSSCGTIFELTPGADGAWTENILYNFCSLPNCADGGAPHAPTLNPAGGLYGMTSGTAFELTSGSNGWTYDVLYTFCNLPNCPDGKDPVGSLTLDAMGNLYGETLEGGTGGDCLYGCGTVFALHPQPNGQWKEVVLYDFRGILDEGEGLTGGVTLHEHGLYATTQAGGGDVGCEGGGCGTVFDLTRGNPSADTSLSSEHVLHAFAKGAQGMTPMTPVEFDQQGNLFGVTFQGGDMDLCGYGCGTVYGMKPESNGKWEFKLLHTFIESDGRNPNSGLTMDSKGNLYGTTTNGGPDGVIGGVVFELSPMKQTSQ